MKRDLTTCPGCRNPRGPGVGYCRECRDSKALVIRNRYRERHGLKPDYRPIKRKVVTSG